VGYQKSDKYLTDENVFQMQHDIMLTNKKDPDKKIIIDTKYKLRDPASDDKKRGVAQSDLYQMTSYAFRRGCNSVLLLYPNCSDQLQKIDSFTISSPFANEAVVRVLAADVPFWSMNSFDDLETTLAARVSNLISRVVDL